MNRHKTKDKPVTIETTRIEIVRFLDTLMGIASIEDVSRNGLQVEGSGEGLPGGDPCR